MTKIILVAAALLSFSTASFSASNKCSPCAEKALEAATKKASLLLKTQELQVVYAAGLGSTKSVCHVQIDFASASEQVQLITSYDSKTCEINKIEEFKL